MSSQAFSSLNSSVWKYNSSGAQGTVMIVQSSTVGARAFGREQEELRSTISRKIDLTGYMLSLNRAVSTQVYFSNGLAGSGAS